MADETFVNEIINDIFISGDKDLRETYLTADALHKPGDVVTNASQTADTKDTVIAASGARPIGGVERAVRNALQGVPRNLDTALADNESYYLHPKGCGNILWGTYQAGVATIKKGHPLIVAAESSKLAPGTVGTTLDDIVYGSVWQDVTTDASFDQKVMVKLNV